MLIFAASPKFDCTPVGGDPAEVLDNCSGVSSVKLKNMIDLCFDIHTARNTDADCKGSEIELSFLLRSRR